MPLLRPRVRRRPRPRPARLGDGRRGDGRGGAHSISRTRRRRSSPRTRSASQILVLASELPERPLVLGGCCCSHVGAVEGLATRHDRFAIVWVDAHGDLNTPESSPSGNEWGMPLRMILDSGAVDPTHVALVGVRDLDPPERDFIRDAGDPHGQARRRARPPRGRLRLRRARLRRPRRGGGRVVHARARRDPARRGGRDVPPPGRRRRPFSAPASPALSPTSAISSPPRGWLRARPVTVLGPGLRSEPWPTAPYRRLDRAQGSHAEPGRRPQASEHLSLVRVALPRRRARQAPRRLPAVRPPLPALGARAHRPARRPGHLRRGGDGAALGRPARLLRPAPVHRTARRGRAEDRPGRRDRDRPRGDRGRAVPALGDGLRLHGRLDGERGRREVRPRVRDGRRAPRPARRR